MVQPYGVACAVHAMEQMPCCPDDAQPQGQAPCTEPDSAATVACESDATGRFTYEGIGR